MLRKFTVTLAISLGLGLFGCREKPSTVQGTVKLAPELSSKLGPSAALYVFARSAGVLAGPPLAVKKFTQPIQFPLVFSLSAQDAMMPDTPFEGRMTITARISQSGSVMPISPGDLEASSGPVATEVGATGVEVAIDRVKQ